ncbi:MAG: potassium transporter TrkA [Anaerolineae bacterium]|nr:MAG: potassium transporter TrkA [Anaerolineae bacterium]WKZ44499.1 MAG: NAD-binding protein [Anaerolineales bacterium]
MKPSFRQKFRYWFDNLMSRGTPAMIGMLFVLSLAVVFVAGAIISIAGFVQEGQEGRIPFGEAAWESLMRTLDSGTMGGDTGAGYRFVMLLVTLGGIFIVSALIGVLNNAIEGQMERLRKGRSQVLESNHTLVLGWSAQIFTVLNELMAANENQSNARIVVLADKDKVEMEDEIRERVEVKGKTRIICRNGSPIDPNDIEIASPHEAKAIIILPPENDDPDTDVIKTALAIANNPNRRAEPYHIITQIRHVKNMDVLKLVGEKDKLQCILTGDLIARVVAQTSRQSGLSVVYTELMDFGGDEIYFKHEPALKGKTFGEALLAYEDSCVMGIRKADGKILLNPRMDSLIEQDDQLFALSADDDTIRLSDPGLIQIKESSIHPSGNVVKPKPEKCLILGWNRSGVTIVRELDNYVPKGSQVTVVADIYNIGKQVQAQGGKLKNQKLVVMEGETTDRDLLNKLGVEDYDHVIVLAYSTLEPQEADAKTLVTLLHLRDMAEKDETPFSIVSEMLDLRNRELAEATQVDDFIVSEHLVSLMMSQLSENAELFDVFTDIFDPEGAEIYLKPIGDYVSLDEPVNFYTVTEAARRRGQTAIGYRIAAQSKDAGKSYGVRTNPRKSEAVVFSSSDKVIVIAEG